MDTQIKRTEFAWRRLINQNYTECNANFEYTEQIICKNLDIIKNRDNKVELYHKKGPTKNITN